MEIDPLYCCLTEKRLDRADTDPTLQGYSECVFWECNTLSEQRKQNAESDFC